MKWIREQAREAFRDNRIGIAASARSSDYFFVHNDNGDVPLLYAVCRREETLARLRAQGAGAED